MAEMADRLSLALMPAASTRAFIRSIWMFHAPSLLECLLVVIAISQVALLVQLASK